MAKPVESFAGADAAVRARKERVHNTMLIELLALLIFLAFAFAFALKEEGDRVNPWKEKYDKLVVELTAVRAENRQLKIDNARQAEKIRLLNETIRRLIAKQDGTLAANDQLVPIPQDELDKLLNDKALLAGLQAENATLRSQLQNGGTDRPNCLVTPSFLISIKLLGNGDFLVSPSWAATAQNAVESVPSAVALGRGGEMSKAEFLAKASAVDGWARSQSTPCGFRARLTNSHSNLELYKRQVATVEKYFYVRRD